MKNTLQSRLIVLMVVSSIFLIAAFTTIQLYNQLQRSAETNLYRANISALVTKDKVQRIFSDIVPGQPQEIALNKIKDILYSELDSKMIEGAVIFNRDGTKAMSQGNEGMSAKCDKAFLDKVSEIKSKSKWLFPCIDKDARIIDLFVVLDNPYGYVIQIVFSLGSLKEALREVYTPVLFTVVIVIIANIILAALLSRALIKPVKILNQATKDIASGDLNFKVSIHTDDEMQELAETFNLMTIALKKMKEKAENANPLTKLPGNIVIQEEVEKQIRAGSKFVLIYCDLDNFKAFNDKYGVHAGDEVIMFTAQVLKDAIAKLGAGGDFIGHEGGDDFLLLTKPERCEAFGDYIIKGFDSGIVKFYSEEDLAKGYIEANARDREEVIKSPIMTISLAGVSNVKKAISTYSQLTNILAEVKKLAKKEKGSKFIIDRRGDDIGLGGRAKA